jgi:hypothetical protein
MSAIGSQTQRARLSIRTWNAIDRFTAPGVREIPRLLGCDTQMPSSMRANLLDDGVVDTLGSVGATSGVHASSGGARIPLRSSSKATNACNYDDGNRPQQYEWPGNIREPRRDIVSGELTVYASTDAGSNISSEGSDHCEGLAKSSSG